MRLRSMKWLKALLVLGGTVFAGAVITLAVIQWTLPTPPQSPELRSISLSPIEIPPSAKLVAVLDKMSETKRLADHFDSAQREVARNSLGDAQLEVVSREPKSEYDSYTYSEELNGERPPRETLEELTKGAPMLDELRDALDTEACLPKVTREDSMGYWMVFNTVSRTLLFQASLYREIGDFDEASAITRALAENLQAMEARCPNALLPSAILATLVSSDIHHELLLLIAASPEHAAEVADAVLAIEQRESPMELVLGYEAQFVQSMLPESGPWPLYIESETRTFIDQVFKRAIWLDSQPLTSPAWSQPLPEQDYVRELEGLSAPAFLRRNGIGHEVITMIAPQLKRMLLSWHQSQCVARARRMALLAKLGEDAGKLPSPLRAPAKHPFYGGGAKRVCGVSERYVTGGMTGREFPDW